MAAVSRSPPVSLCHSVHKIGCLASSFGCATVGGRTDNRQTTNKRILEKEKALTRDLDALAAMRRRQPAAPPASRWRRTPWPPPGVLAALGSVAVRVPPEEADEGRGHQQSTAPCRFLKPSTLSAGEPEHHTVLRSPAQAKHHWWSSAEPNERANRVVSRAPERPHMRGRTIPITQPPDSPIPPGSRAPEVRGRSPLRIFSCLSRMYGSEGPRSSRTNRAGRYRPNPVGRLVEDDFRNWPLSGSSPRWPSWKRVRQIPYGLSWVLGLVRQPDPNGQCDEPVA